MQGNTNPRVIGACLIGCALVAGAYTISNFGIDQIPVQQAAVSASASTARVAIAVTDEDQNGIEDWRDEFVQTEAINVDPIAVDENYEPPTTLTGQLGVNFIESYMVSKTQGAFGRSQAQLVEDTVNVLATETAHDLFDTPDITIMSTWEEADILTYANTIALAISNNNNASITEGELFILHDIVTNGATQRIGELLSLADTYKQMRDDTLATPVPALFTKEHLDLINTYHALHKDIQAMAIALDDPAFSLMRLKRYEDDAAGLGFALTNMYNAFEPYAALVQPEDPALLFVLFSPEYKS